MLIDAEERLGDLAFHHPDRVVHLPLSWRDPATIEPSRSTWVPSATMRRGAGQHRIHPPHQWPASMSTSVENLIFEAQLPRHGPRRCLLGAPVATPVDPRHRLVTTKYNPARTWTPPNVVGIGGAYYVHLWHGRARRLPAVRHAPSQVWNTYQPDRSLHRRQTVAPALLRPDPLLSASAHEELTEWRRDFPWVAARCRIEPSDIPPHRTTAKFAGPTTQQPSRHSKRRRQAAFDAERADWQRAASSTSVDRPCRSRRPVSRQASPQRSLMAPTWSKRPCGGSVWKLLVTAGRRGRRPATLIAVIEAMKTGMPGGKPWQPARVRALYTEEKQSAPARLPDACSEADGHDAPA